ncbi:MAG: hypothetical protein AMQ22_00252 [Candidatus Methanofastidiosum methylothiophilum]|uniref:Uncharacterized protein n=1 Tax=Candidatus Methanofastidiosum methylothiophilum TaxID=1705564 RepID=A0A150J895_9EURY|nr:MAG: hypothetical protein AMQ22_00252 [Candidatus Methanofastidiosum methylthiophilus]
MRAKFAIGLIVFVMAVATVSVSAEYPSVVDGDSGPNVPGPTKTVGCNYAFVVNAPLGTYQSVQVVIGGVAYDMIFDNSAWRAEICVSPGQTYFYRLTTRHGLKFESGVQKI